MSRGHESICCEEWFKVLEILKKRRENLELLSLINRSQDLSNAEQEVTGKCQGDRPQFFFNFLVKFQLTKEFVCEREEVEQGVMEGENEN